MGSFSLNKVQLIGNVVADLELQVIPNGTSVTSFSLATNRTYKDAAGEKHEETEFHSIVVWANLAEHAANLLKKGMKVYIEGRLKTRAWEDKDGMKRSKTEIILEHFILLDKKEKDENIY